MRRILLPTIDYPPARGGVARYIGAIQQTYPNNVTVLPIQRLKLDWLVWKLLWKSRIYDAVWVHHVLPIGTAAMIVKKMTKKTYVVFLHGLDFDMARRNAWKRWLTTKVLLSADQIVTNSEALASEVRQFVTLNQSPLVVYPTLEDQFIEEEKTLNPPNKVNIRKLGELAMGVANTKTPMFVVNSRTDDRPLRLLTVGRLVDRKGHLKVIEALSRLENVVYHIVGNGPMLGTIQKLITDFGLNDRVQISLAINDQQLSAVYRDADVFVMPTTKTERDREGFGIVYLEAQLFGLPVIATKYPGVDEAVHDGQGGVLINDSVSELITAIVRLKDPALRRALGVRGKARVLHEFTREQQMYKLRSLL